MFRVGICDDDAMFIQYIKRLFCELYEEITFCEYLSGEELIEKLDKNQPLDLLILDILMPGMDGNKTAKEFRKQCPNTLLVFCSGVCTPTTESFETTPYRFWLKEYTEEKMKLEIQAVLKKMQENQKESPFILVKKGNQMVKISANQVYYVAIAKKGTVFYCGDEKETYTSTSKLAEVYGRLKEFGFVYAHNSYIVNLQYVKVVSLKELEFDNGKQLTISRSRAKEFRKAFAEDVAHKYER